MSDDDRDLAAARGGGEGSHQAFARIYDRHAPVVLALCRGKLRSSAESDDALQETFIRAHRMLDRVESAAGVRSWLFAIAGRVCAERARSSSRRTKHEGVARMNASLNHHPAATPGDSAEHAEQLRLLGRAIDELPEQERIALHLYYLDADPVGAAADALGISRSGFYKLLARARDHLSLRLSQPNPS